MYKRFIQIMDCSDCLTDSRVVVAAADRESIEAVKLAMGRGLGGAVFVGDRAAISPIISEFKIAEKSKVIDASSPEEAAALAVAAIKDGGGNVLLKGLVNTQDFLRAVLSKECGLRTGRLLSHLSVMEIPGENHLSFCADSGFNVAPDLEQKKKILRNSLEAIHAMGYEHVNVACLAANEKVDPHIPSTVDAAKIAEAWRSGEFDDLPCTCTVEGPMALDVVASKKAAEHKGINSVIAGKVDLTLVPNIECGNVHCKTLTHYCHAQLAGLVLGAAVPIVLVSRSDSAETKFMSMALACIVSRGMESNA